MQLSKTSVSTTLMIINTSLAKLEWLTYAWNGSGLLLILDFSIQRKAKRRFLTVSRPSKPSTNRQTAITVASVMTRSRYHLVFILVVFIFNYFVALLIVFRTIIIIWGNSDEKTSAITSARFQRGDAWLGAFPTSKSWKSAANNLIDHDYEKWLKSKSFKIGDTAFMESRFVIR